MSQQTGRRTPSSRGPEHNRTRTTRENDSCRPQKKPSGHSPPKGEVRRANSPRHYELLPGAVMGLTIEAIGIYDAQSSTQTAPMRWPTASPTFLGPPGRGPIPPRGTSTWRDIGWASGERGARMLFYNLDELGAGDRIVLRDRSGRAYEYRVSEVFLAEPTDAWVMGQVRGRDMVSLQTCTPLYTFEKRLIVRADRV